MPPKQAPFFGLFKAEAAEHLQPLQRGLLTLQHHPQDATVLREMTQSADTLMGSALTMGFEEMSQHARSMRELLGAAHDGTSPLDAATLTRLSQSLNTICTLVDAVALGENGDTLMGVSQMTILAMRIALDQLLHEIVHLEQQPGSATRALQVCPIAHALKEHAASNGWDAITQVAQRLEGILHAAAEATLTITGELRGLLLQGVGFIEFILDAVAMGNEDEAEVGELCAMLDEILAAVAPAGRHAAPIVSDVPHEAGEGKSQEMPDMGHEVQRATAGREHLKVLIASNSPLFSRMLSHVLGQEQHEVILTSDARDVVVHLRNKDIDLCFVRDALPDGFDICEHFARGLEGKNSIPIIVYSPLARVKQRALASGAADFLQVPCPPQQVLELVSRWGRLPRRP